MSLYIGLLFYFLDERWVQMDNAIYDSDGNLMASRGDPFDKHLEHLQTNLALSIRTVFYCILFGITFISPVSS